MCCSCGQNKQPDSDVAAKYSLMTVSETDKSLSVKYSAVLEGRQDVEVRPQVSGIITKVCVEEGAKVRKGQVLFVIDQRTYKAALQKARAAVASAKASLATARQTLEGKKELYEKNVVSAFELQTAQNAYDSAEAALQQAVAEEDSAAADYSYTEVRSPVRGGVQHQPADTVRIGAGYRHHRG